MALDQKHQVTSELPRPLRAYIGLMALLGGAWLSYLLYAEITWGLATVGKMGLVVLLLIVAGNFPLSVGPKVKTDVTTAILFAGVLLLEPGAIGLAGAVGVVTYTFCRLRLPWYKYPFNAGVTAIYVGLASYLFHNLADQDVILATAVAPAAAVMYVTNTVLVSVAAGLQLRNNPLRFWWAGTRDNGPAELSLLAFGFLGALAYRQSPWTVVAMAIPVAIIYLAFSRLDRANTELEKALEKLEALQGDIANNAKLTSIGAMSLEMAHQIKNPLAIIIGRLETLQDHLEEGSRHHRQVDIALDAAWRIRELTDNFTSMGQRRWIDLDMPSLLNEAYGMAGLQSHNRVETRWEYDDRLPKVAGNPVLVREALTNILCNAMEAVSEGGLITTSATRSNGYVIVRISDDGRGIPDEAKPHLFEPFYSSKPHGSGLGLFAAKHILEMHKGSLEIESEEGRGTKVTIKLPAATAENANGTSQHRLDGTDNPSLARSR